MSQLLDLAITLTPPPPGAPEEAIASISLRCDPQGLTYSGDLLRDPLTKQEREDLHWYLEDYSDWPYEQFFQRAKKIENLLDELGDRLYKAVFGSFGAMAILQAWRLQPGNERQVSIISDMPVVLSLPWELLHDEQGFLALRTRHPVSIVRRMPQSELAAFPTQFEPPLRVLVVTARPDDAGFVDPRSIGRELLDEVQEHIDEGTIAVEFLRPPTLQTLRTRLADSKRPPIHVLHFDGHGTFRPESVSKDGLRLRDGEQGMLLFENEDGKRDLVKAETLGDVLQDSGVRLAVLNACQSAISSAEDAFSSVATRLIRSGVDAVVAMSASVLVACATRYVEAFYRELSAGTSAPIAHERARQALHDNPRRHLMSRRRDEEGQPVELQDWWLPHFYQQRPLVLQPTRPSGQLDLPPATSERLSDTMPAEPRYGFSGRAYELLQIERKQMRGQLVVIHGFGGVGKTALVRETADWLTRTKMYDGACFVSFEHGGDAATLLSALGNFMGVYDGHYNPNDAKTALAKLAPALKQKRTLVIADNMESILPGGDAPLEAGVRSQLWDVLLKISNMGAGVLLTTRDTNFGDGKMEPGKYVAHMALAGLHPEDAYALASRLLEYLEIDRAKAPYVELRDLLKQLDYHPLAIQLVLPALRETSLSLAKIKADFGALLPNFVDDTETGRNRSLLASLDFSLRRLSEEQRALLPRLALFEGGASEDDLLAITEIPEGDWVKLRPALEQAALITVEEVRGFTAPFLRFHPVLAPYLRSLQGANDEALRERYAKRYYGLAGYLYLEDNRNPQAVRALVWLELPNLRRAFGLLLDAGELDGATQMADSIAKFLNVLGLRRELEELRQRVGKAVAATRTQNDGKLTWAEYLRESGLGDDELGKGELSTAYIRFTKLLDRISRLPEDTRLGRGSYAHCVTLHRLARCLRLGGQSVVAEGRLREALKIIEALIKQQAENQSFIRQRGTLLPDLGDILMDQGRYQEAQIAYEEALEIGKQIGELRNQAVVLGQLGELARRQKNYSEARSLYLAALERFRALSEPGAEAIIWHQLGTVAQSQERWVEAEYDYRQSLTIKEQQGNLDGAAKTCNHLAIVAQRTNRPTEAEGWWKRAIELYDQVQTNSLEHAKYFGNLARLIIDEVQARHASMERLNEARNYTERALVIKEKLDTSSEIWNTLNILANIADLEGRIEDARTYRRRERETFAAFEGYRYHIDHQHRQLIDAIAAARDNMQARQAVEEVLPKLEEDGWKIAAATHRIWAGERDWHSLAEGIDSNSALLILRVLETIARPEEVQDMTLEQVFASLPVAIREAMERGDQVALQKAFDALSLEEQQAVAAAIQFLQSQQDEGDEDDEDIGESGG